MNDSATSRIGVPAEVHTPRPRMVFLVTEYYFFHAMRNDLAPAAIRREFDIHVVAYCGNSGDMPLHSEFQVIDFPWRRSRSLWRAALQFVPEVIRVRRLLRALAPDVLHNIAMKPSIIGALAMWDRPARIVNTLTGLGFVFYARSLLARIAQRLCAMVLRHAAGRNDAQIVVHNATDRTFVSTHLGVPAAHVHLIRGLGIDTRHFVPQPRPPQQPFRVLVIARLLYMKGIAVAIAAHDILRARGVAVELAICGGPDVDNPSAIPDDVIAEWARRPQVRFLGQVADVRAEIAASHVMMHPALGGEGLPRVLLEGAACGRALIASNVSGNTDIVIDGENGLLVPPNDAPALANAVIWMMQHPAEEARMAENGRARVLQEFASEHIAASYATLYRALCPVG